MLLGSRFKFDGKSSVTLNRLQSDTRDELNKAISQGRYVQVQTQCAVCKGSDFDGISEKDRFGVSISLVICRDCGLIHINPRLSEDSYADFYDNFYNGIHLGSELDEKWYQGRYEKGEEIFSFLESKGYLRDLKAKLALEVGCAAGGIIHYFKDQGFQVKGTDLSSTRIRYGVETHGLDLHHGGLENLTIDKRPDLIIYSHVLEHVPDLVKELGLIHETLDDDGLVYIEVPGVKDLDNQHVDLLKTLQLAHVYYFSLRSLQNLMEANGFELLYGDEEIRSVFRKSQGFVSDERIVNDYRPTIEYLSALEDPLTKALLLSRNHLLRLAEAAGVLPLLREVERKFKPI